MLLVSGIALMACGGGGEQRKDFIAACSADPHMNEALCTCVAEGVEKQMGRLPPAVIFKASSDLTDEDRTELRKIEESYSSEEREKLMTSLLNSLFTCSSKVAKDTQ